MRLSDRQFSAVKKASEFITLKRCQAIAGLAIDSIIQPEVTRQIKMRGSVYLSLYAWAYYSFCINGTGLGEKDAINHFLILFLKEEEEGDLNMTPATFREAEKLKKTSPKLVELLVKQALNDFKGRFEEFHVTLRRAFEIESQEQQTANHTHTVSCPFCAKDVQISNIVEKTAFRCAHCNQVFNVQP